MKDYPYVPGWRQNKENNKPTIKHSVLMFTTHGIVEGEWVGNEWMQYRWSCKVKDIEVLYWMHLEDLTQLEKEGDCFQQEQPEGLHFIPLNRLIQKIPSKNWNDTVNNYAKKLCDCLIKEGYLKDATVLQGYISYMNGNNVPMATMDEQEQPEADLVAELKRHLATTPKEQLEKEWKELEPWCNIGPTVQEFLYGEQPEVDLVKEMDKFYGVYRDKTGKTYDIKDDEPCFDWKEDELSEHERRIAHHFYELGLKARKEDDSHE